MPRLPKKAPSLSVDDPARRRLPILLRRAWYGLNQAFRRRIAHTGVTPDQFTALRTLIEGDPAGLPQSELTRLMASDPNTIASLVQRMKTAGIVDRQTHERDRRAYRIKIKPLGRKKYEEVREIAIALQMEILSALPADRRENFLEELALVADTSQVTAENSPRK